MDMLVCAGHNDELRAHRILGNETLRFPEEDEWALLHVTEPLSAYEEGHDFVRSIGLETERGKSG